MSQNAIWYDNLLDFFMLFVLIMQIGTQLGHEKVVKMDPFFGCLGYTEYQKGVVVEAQSWHLCTGSGFIPGKSQNTLELAIATGKCRKSLLAAEARLWPIPDAILFKFGSFPQNSTPVWRTDGWTDRPTDGPTDRRTDTTSYWDATAHLKGWLFLLLKG